VAQLYLDNDVALGLIAILEAAGHSAIATRDVGRSHAPDYQQMVTAWQRGAVLVTHNRDDYIDQVEAWQLWPRAWGVAGPEHPGVIVPDQCPPATYAPALLAFLAADHRKANRLYTWRRRTATWQLRDIGGGSWRPFPVG
jgi:hypothetical protein